MKALILAAGYGTRLYPFTRNYPKALMKVKGKAIIGYLIDKLRDIEGLSKIIIVTNDRFYGFFHEWKKTLEIKDRIRIINDRSTSPKNKLGAIGDMYLAFSKEGIDEDYIVLGGDNFLKEPLEGFVRFAKSKTPYASIGVFDIKSRQEARHFGVVKLDSRKVITDFKEKPVHPASSLVATCLYYLPLKKLKFINKYLDESKISFDNIGAYINWLTENDKVYAYAFKKLWVDIGRVETYNKLQKIMEGEK